MRRPRNLVTLEAIPVNRPEVVNLGPEDGE